jgi:hypothetical protein
MVLPVVLNVTGCGGSQSSNMQNPNVSGPATLAAAADPTAPPAPIEVDGSLCDESGKRVEKYDLNRDGKPDVWEIYSTANDASGQSHEYLGCRMVDLNGDGRVDMTTYFNQKNERILEMCDLDYDGRPDEWVYYTNGIKVRTAMDSSGSGVPDTWRIYDPGAQGSDLQRLQKVERASKDPKKVDYWEFWSNGQLQRIGYDTNGDGQIDQWLSAADLGQAAPSSGPAPSSEPAIALPSSQPAGFPGQ